MPGCITHYIFAKDCFDKLDNNNLKNILSKNINIYLLGSCGPNFFEYCNNVPNIFSKNLAASRTQSLHSLKYKFIF